MAAAHSSIGSARLVAGGDQWRTFLRVAAGALACAVLLWLTLAVTLPAVSSTSPLAATFAPGDVRVLSAEAQSLAGQAQASDGTSAGLRSARAKAVAALRRDATAVGAARTLGILDALEGRPTRARRLARYAEALSRRDVPTQLWLIQDRVDADDFRGALSHFDVALRTSTGVQPLLLPVLINALDDAAIRTRLGEILATKPNWRLAFMSNAIANARALPGMAALAEDLARRASPLDDDALSRLLGRMIAERRFAEAAAVHDLSRKEARISSNRLVRNGGFEQQSTSVPPFAWLLTQQGDSYAEPILRDDGVGRALSFHALVDGVLARQLLMMPPGRYNVAATSTLSSVEPGARVSLALTCVDREGDPLTAAELPQTSRPAVLHASAIVPSSEECPAQWLILVVSGAEGTGATEGWLDDVRVVPLKAVR